MENTRDSRKINALESLAVVDALGNLIHVQLSSGDIHDENIADDILDHVDLNGTTVQADKAYGSYRLREYIANRNADFCIPPNQIPLIHGSVITSSTGNGIW